MFNKHSTAIKNRVLSATNAIQDFDIIEDTIYVQTSAETITEKYIFKDGVFKNNAGSKSVIT